MADVQFPRGDISTRRLRQGALRLVAWAKDLRFIGLGSGAKRVGVELPQLERAYASGSTFGPSLGLTTVPHLIGLPVAHTSVIQR